MLNNLRWLNAEQRVFLIKKVNEISIDVTIPSWVSNDSEINRRTARFSPNETLMFNDLQAQRKQVFEEVKTVISIIIVFDVINSFSADTTTDWEAKKRLCHFSDARFV